MAPVEHAPYIIPSIIQMYVMQAVARSLGLSEHAPYEHRQATALLAALARHSDSRFSSAPATRRPAAQLTALPAHLISLAASERRRVASFIAYRSPARLLTSLRRSTPPQPIRVLPLVCPRARSKRDATRSAREVHHRLTWDGLEWVAAEVRARRERDFRRRRRAKSWLGQIWRD